LNLPRIQMSPEIPLIISPAGWWPGASIVVPHLGSGGALQAPAGSPGLPPDNKPLLSIQLTQYGFELLWFHI
jgi:hypothetical protein